MSFAIQSILELNGFTTDNLSMLSYKSQLGISLKRSIGRFDKDLLFNELLNIIDWYDMQELLFDIPSDYRIKSIDSIERKYNKFYPNTEAKKVFNDILGFRLLCNDYAEILCEENKLFKIADMSNGKAIDDGYRGVHLYFQLDNFHYPIEIQINTYYDRMINDMLHKYIYKVYDCKLGCIMRGKCENGSVKNEKEFQEVLNNVLFNS